MVVGMGLFGVIWDAVWPGLTGRPDGMALTMAFDMTVGMAAWMWVRRHARRHIAEMSAVMVLPFLVLLVPYWLGVLPGDTLLTWGHVGDVRAHGRLPGVASAHPGHRASPRTAGTASHPARGLRCRLRGPARRRRGPGRRRRPPAPARRATELPRGRVRRVRPQHGLGVGPRPAVPVGSSRRRRVPGPWAGPCNESGAPGCPRAARRRGGRRHRGPHRRRTWPWTASPSSAPSTPGRRADPGGPGVPVRRRGGGALAGVGRELVLHHPARGHRC